ncbi:acyltransferase, partial [Yersinia sp. 1252 StPb PI]|uniref:acyltransferase family protein n=1 Tax=Yersinia sp. 1252 StPb PI TaxID=3117404 RepID=UPI003B28D102
VTIYAHLGFLFSWLPSWYIDSFNYFTPAVGVDLFFCISGYVITKSIYKSGMKERGFLSLALPFWIRRMWRLWPSSFAWLVVTLIAARYFNWNNSFHEFEYNVYSSIAALFQVANVYFTHCIQNSNCGSNMVYWSLSLEEQFYFIFPFAIFFMSKKTLSLVLFIAILAQFFIFRDNGSLAWT